MTVSKSPRLGLTRWDDDDDPWDRADWDGDSGQLEALAAIARQGANGSRGSAAPALARSFFYATDTGELSYCTGSSWVTISRANSDGIVTYGAKTATAGDGSSVYLRHGVVTLALEMTTNANLSANDVLGTLTTPYRPGRRIPTFLRIEAGGWLRISVETNGNIVARAAQSGTVGLVGVIPYPAA